MTTSRSALARVRRRSAPIAFAMAAQFLWSIALWTPRAHAADDVPLEIDRPAETYLPTPTDVAQPAAAPPSAPATAEAAPVAGGLEVDKNAITPNGTKAIDRKPSGSDLTDPKGLPTGADKSGVTSQAISIPKGAGKIEGMGESFSAQLSTGIATFTIPFALPSARGGSQPSLTLSYSSSSGHGVAGVGWELGVPFISRQTDRGLPKYKDPAEGGAWHPEMDRFVFNGGQELVPICLVTGAACTGALAGEVMPAWANGWMYFRPRVEGSFLRFFWSRNHKTWVVQSKSGETMELGVPQDSERTDALETDPADARKIFRWNLVRQYDAQRVAGKPVNVVAFRYAQVGGLAYLTDIWDTPPAAEPTTAPTSSWAHHTRVRYDGRTDPTFSFRRGWRTTQTLRVAGVDVASKPFEGGSSPARELVRRYHLSYDGKWHASLLTSVQMEGRCAAPVLEDASEAVPPTSCPKLPEMTFGYQHVKTDPVTGEGVPGDLPGYESWDETVRAFDKSPPFSVDEELTDLFDINADALPDVLVTAPAFFGGKHGVFLNGAAGKVDGFGATACPMAVEGVAGADVGTITLKNLNVAPGDFDGDGRIDLVHMPKVKTYSVYTPSFFSDLAKCGGSWVGRAVTSKGLSPKIDLGKDAAEIRMVDVNGDGLVDAVYSAGTELQTFYSLGRYRDGDGRFGDGKWTSAHDAFLTEDPVRTCLPWSGTPVRFSDAEIKLADMNGDGLADIVKIQKGNIQYWPGRGDGHYGTGALDDCPAGTFGASRSIDMTTSPWFTEPNVSALRLDDVNGDGLDDLVQVRFTDVDIWLNVDGIGWTERHTVKGTPAAPSYASRVRLVDANGSGTRDVLWGDAAGYKYIDLLGGKRPWVLTKVSNGLGKTSEIEYSTSTALMLAAEREAVAKGKPELAWKSKAPIPLHVVVRETTRDNLGAVGRPAGVYVTEYTYRDPYYDGLQREFRGFEQATVRRVGDENSPSSSTTTAFELGKCKDIAPTPGLPSACAPQGDWQDNPREALKGLPLWSTTFDDKGVHLSTVHHGYRLKKLYQGLDGRAVKWAYESESDAFLYDTAAFTPSGSTRNLSTVFYEETGTGEDVEVPIASLNGRVRIRSSVVVDTFGNRTFATAFGCTEGCSPVDDEIYSTTNPGRPAGDESGWMWRTVSSWVSSKKDPRRRNETTTTYDAFGNPTSSSAVLWGTLPLDRFHEDSGKMVAGDPAAQSTNGSIALGEQHYDAFGNLVFTSGPLGRCRSVAYDSEFADLPLGETIFANSPDPTPRTIGGKSYACGSVQLQASAEYDRGLEAITQVTDLHGEKSNVEYDGFGRTVALTKPHPDPAHVGELSPKPAVKIEYLLTTNPKLQPYSLLHTSTQDAVAVDGESYRESWAYVDGLGRTFATLDQADKEAGDLGNWVVNGFTDYDAKGAARRAFLAWFWDGDPKSFLATVKTATTRYETKRYDAFGRGIVTYGLDGTPLLAHAYHALSEDAWDAADLLPGPHHGTPATVVKDGHGRTTATIERIHVGSSIEARSIETEYLPTGEVQKITRRRLGKPDAPVVRWILHDSLGRMVLNVEPNTSAGFVAEPITDAASVPDTLKAWRYAWDDAGELVGTSDARGCGTNYFYDTAGRLTGEDYSPCLAHHQDYSSPDWTYGSESGLEVLNRYDYLALSPNPIKAEEPACTMPTTLYAGRLVEVLDRGAHTVTAYDGRGRITCVARQMGKPGTPADFLADRYAPRWYVQVAEFDSADRPIKESTGAKVAEMMGGDGKSIVETAYSKRGSVKWVGGSYGTLVQSVAHDADGLATQIVYGDAASTTTEYGYDDKRRLRTVQTYRGPPAIWTSPPAGYDTSPYGSGVPSTFQLVLDDLLYEYDAVDNPIEIRDFRDPKEWPAGAKPVTRKIEYDDLYRVSRVEYHHTGGADSWVSPFDHENTVAATGGTLDPRLAMPSPHVAFDKRIQWESFQYDWLGNTVTTGDDAKGFYDRSLGTITNGTVNAGPYQLKAASNVASGGTRTGNLTAKYDYAGHLVSLAVKRNGPCLPTGAQCSQRFVYEWDEAGRLARARRWDLAASGNANDVPPTISASAELRYQYDCGDQRTLKTSIERGGGQRHTAHVFGGLELRGSEWTGSDYARAVPNEVPQLIGGGMRIGRLAHESVSVPSPSPIDWSSPQLHVLLVLSTHLGSTAHEVDLTTGELVETSSFTAYGGADSSHRIARWSHSREADRFTGKPDDVEVGLIYFGFRYYLPSLGRWASADPLAIQGLGADPNAYAYVSGTVLRARDPLGLDSEDATTGAATDDASAPAGTVDDGIAQDSAAPPSRALTGTPPGRPYSVSPITPFGQAHFDAYHAMVAPGKNGLERAAAAVSWLATAPFAIPDLVYTGALEAPGHAIAGGENIAAGHVDEGAKELAVGALQWLPLLGIGLRMSGLARTLPAGRDLSAAVAPPMGPVELSLPADYTAEELAQAQRYVAACNEAVADGLVLNGRVSTKGALRKQADYAARQEKLRATTVGTPYKGVPGHGPDTTWTGLPRPPVWIDMSPRLNASFGAQALRYPAAKPASLLGGPARQGYVPTEFVLKMPEF